MSQEADPLMALVVDTRQISREQLAQILKGRVLLDLQSDSFVLQPGAKARSNAGQAVLLSLLAVKALSLLKPNIPDILSPKELENVTGLRGGTIRPAVRRLSAEGLVIRRAEGYTIHSSALARVAIALHERESDKQ
jgi:hypothetical protein